MKKLCLIILFLFCFSFNASADIYSEQLEISGANELENSLPQEISDFFEREDINLSDSGWVNKITAGNIFSMLFDSLKSDGKTPLITGAAIIGVILILAAFRLFSDKPENEQALSFVGTCISAGAVLLPVFSVITATARTLKAGAEFMLAFVPIYSTVLFASGRPMTSAASGTMLLTAGEGVVWLSSNIVTALIGSYLAVCMCGNISPVINMSGIAEFMKKCANWILGLIMTVYMGILGIQTTVNASADNLAIKTGKFMIGSFVPVVGGPVSEALTTVQSCMGLLRSSVGIYGVVALALVLLPALLQLIIWRGVLLFCSSVATVFECPKIAVILKAADSALSFLLGIMLICSVAFIISLTVITTAGG